MESNLPKLTAAPADLVNNHLSHAGFAIGDQDKSVTGSGAAHVQTFARVRAAHRSDGLPAFAEPRLRPRVPRRARRVDQFPRYGKRDGDQWTGGRQTTRSARGE